ncbi:MAG: oxaloacetate decarboxylase [Rhodospirillales bacterium]|tara:strand:- start:5595 stop:6452 length:858 start_codon:yes stop_codon:yes gene_type:complete
MNWDDRRLRFRKIMEQEICENPASVFDPISGRIAEELEYKVGIFAGSIASVTILGDPDLLLITLSEFSDQAHRISRSNKLPLLVDADHGYGNALNVRRTVQELETSGVAALTIEDTELPISYGAYNNPSLLSIDEGIGKMKAAIEAREDPNLSIIARTSAFQLSNDEDAINRAKAYENAGVDAIFFAGIDKKEQLEELSNNTSIPIFIAPTGNELYDKTYLASKNVKICLIGHHPLKASIQAVYDTLKSLKDGVPTTELKNIASRELIDKVIKKGKYEALIKRYL